MKKYGILKSGKKNLKPKYNNKINGKATNRR